MSSVGDSVVAWTLLVEGSFWRIQLGCMDSAGGLPSLHGVCGGFLCFLYSGKDSLVYELFVRCS
jgi:hypothetical protein